MNQIAFHFCMRMRQVYSAASVKLFFEFYICSTDARSYWFPNWLNILSILVCTYCRIWTNITLQKHKIISNFGQIHIGMKKKQILQLYEIITRILRAFTMQIRSTTNWTDEEFLLNQIITHTFIFRNTRSFQISRILYDAIEIIDHEQFHQLVNWRQFFTLLEKF